MRRPRFCEIIRFSFFSDNINEPVDFNKAISTTGKISFSLLQNNNIYYLVSFTLLFVCFSFSLLSFCLLGYGVFNVLLLLATLPIGWTAIFDTTSGAFILASAECDLELTFFRKGVLLAFPYIGTKVKI